MNRFEKRVLTRCNTLLLNDLRPKDLLNYLTEYEAISHDQCKIIESIEDEKAQVVELMGCLRKSTNRKTYEVFLNALKEEDYQHIFDKLKSLAVTLQEEESLAEHNAIGNCCILILVHLQYNC